MEIVVRGPADALPAVEVVEHKGTGHPDTMCDAVAESFGVALSRFYRERFGAIAHFNVDKALLVGGAAVPAFRGGEVTLPMRMILAGRASAEVSGVRVPVEELAFEAGKRWVREHMHALDPERHVAWSCMVQKGSRDLAELFGASSRDSVLANDTSIGAGHAPLSMLERTVLLAAERLRALSREDPAVGEDIKVMGMRHGERTRLTVACAFVGAHLDDMEQYAERRDFVQSEVREAVTRVLDQEVYVEVNTADDVSKGRVYLTVTGTSAEAGDDGQVGRGNRVNGLITPYRAMSLEAAAGKNPVSHVGKLYNVAAHRIAAAIVARAQDVREAECILMSRIGRRSNDPAMVDVRLRMRGDVPVEAVRAEVRDAVTEVVTSLGALTDELSEGRVRLY